MSILDESVARKVRYRPGVQLEDLETIMTNTDVMVWEALRGRRLFITGGTGFIGCWIVEALLWAHEVLNLGLQLTLLSRDTKAFTAKAPWLTAHPATQLVEGNIHDLTAISQQFDIILHAATDVVAPSNRPLDVFNDIVSGATETLALANRCGAQRYLLLSSGAVYGQQPEGMSHVPEHYLGAPHISVTSTAYGQGKRVAEWLVSCAGQESKIETRVARCFTFVGPYMALDAQFAIGNFILDAYRGDAVKVGGDGTPYRSYLYAADLAIWLLTILVNGDEQPYNVGSSAAISIKDLATQVSTVLRGTSQVEVSQAVRPGHSASYYVPNVERAAKLGLREYTNLQTAVTRTAAWHHKIYSKDI